MNYRGQDNMRLSIGISTLSLEPVGLLRVKLLVGSRGNRENLGKNLFSKKTEGLTLWKT